MDLQNILETQIKMVIKSIYQVDIDKVNFQATRKDFEGDITVVVFSFLKKIKGNPEIIGDVIGRYLTEHTKEVFGYNTVKGFLNLVISDNYYISYLNKINLSGKLPYQKQNTDKVYMVEYSSPNTNKPLHLGHIRNNLLGHSVAKILEANGNSVHKTQIINDRGIHICKSMLAWQRFGNDETPEITKTKGDKFAGKYYVLFDKYYKQEVQELVDKGIDKAIAEKQSPLLVEAQDMLKRWENNDPNIIALWKKMNSWVYKGFKETYKKMGIDFDSEYYESDTYLFGKDVIEEGLEKKVFFRKPDKSVWIDLTDEGLDEKLVLRSDGTSVYMTQDLGTAFQRYKDIPSLSGMIYTVGNEQDYHFKVLFIILKKLGCSWASELHHLSYGMVDLPDGKMKSREGTVVDADELIDDMVKTAKNISEKLGKLDKLSEVEKNKLFHTIGLGALKYYILKVDPKKRILFDPKESIDFNGNTGPFIQYTYARIQSILNDFETPQKAIQAETLHEKEKEVIKHLIILPQILEDAGKNYSPALIVNYTYDLVKIFNSFYQNVPILKAKNQTLKHLRVALSNIVGNTIEFTFDLLGIDVPKQM